MRPITEIEATAIEKAERRASWANHWRLRQSALAGQIALISAVISSLDDTSPRTRAGLEPRLYERQALLLRAESSLPFAVRFFQETSNQLTSSVLGKS